jgi:hypothetical protein
MKGVLRVGEIWGRREVIWRNVVGTIMLSEEVLEDILVWQL